MKIEIVREFTENKAICLEVSSVKRDGEKVKVIRVRAAKKAKRLFNRTIDKKAEYKRIKEALGLKKGMNVVSKELFLETVAAFKETAAA